MLNLYAPQYDISPELAAAVIQTESSFNRKAVGPVGEIGLFQVRPEFSPYTAEQLTNIEINIHEGLRILSNAKKRCPHKSNKQFVVCYNVGVKGGYKIQKPETFRYYKKVYSNYEKFKVSML